LFERLNFSQYIKSVGSDFMGKKFKLIQSQCAQAVDAAQTIYFGQKCQVFNAFRRLFPKAIAKIVPLGEISKLHAIFFHEISFTSQEAKITSSG
jgi:hypothetical protein